MRAIRSREKLLLILSENSIGSNWVEDEVNKAFAEAGQGSSLSYSQSDIDDAVMQSPEAWARKLRDQRTHRRFPEVDGS